MMLELSAGGDWYALRVRPNHERTCAIALGYKGFEPFVPMYKSRRKWSDRVKELERPVFAGYVFCRFVAGSVREVVSTPGVSSVVAFANVPARIDEAEIEALRVAAQSGRPLEPYPYVNIGDRVRIDGGPLDGLEGILVQVKNSLRLVLSVTLLQRSVAVEVDNVRAAAARA